MTEPRVIIAWQTIQGIPSDSQHIPQGVIQEITNHHTATIGRNLSPTPPSKIHPTMPTSPAPRPVEVVSYHGSGVELCWAHNHVGFNLPASCGGLRACSLCDLQARRTLA